MNNKMKMCGNHRLCHVRIVRGWVSYFEEHRPRDGQNVSHTFWIWRMRGYGYGSGYLIDSEVDADFGK